MSSYKSDFLRELETRGFIHQLSDAEGIDEAAVEKIVTGYIGFDATAPSLHAGSLVQIMLLRWLQKAGHRPIALMGGGTTRIGDPSFRDDARPLLTDEKIDENLNGIKAVFAKFLTFGNGKTDAVMVNNRDWLDDLHYIDFLRDYGRHFSVNRMLSFDSVKIRLDREQNLSFLEFNYMILQAYDFVELNRKYGCTLQMGGSDQWGNIVNGIELGRRADGSSLYGLTSPLLTTSSGAKMGKTASGAVWLNADMLSPYDYWQYWRNAEDADVGRFLKLFTELPLDEIARLEKLEGSEVNEAKKVLATEATAMAHGRAEAEKAANAARTAFEEGAISADMPTVEIEAFETGLGLLTALVQAGLCSSTSDARRQIKGGAVRVNDAQIGDEKMVLAGDDLTSEGVIKLSLGKKKHVLLKPKS
ncbi:tyrosine--tRNA ligase [Parvibaculum sp.]|jgi:tyrosyl-tRNA synthetase|uniref:tyrosine--tRNA ligase n=1 Tax=Parvibaculum sp. TaxID=2024848 RepID=UPI001B1A43E7|nr:tyrosine--tRNA ligase [Parvibaculum sp.]MBO6634535.1 tyrosine--tRNA ligase [Parvibaculum sp.]MBO6678990.1 tyrosine--tRNA ligase [Parvibaculum sp.]MBO6686089.1 tyrosine--tRNA ligase [Parvibaculum sp.]MBO6906182.1 tyrosine--tRNA ligase [Parvibaculum sp.]